MIKDVLKTAKETKVDRGYELDAESVTELLNRFYSEPFSLVLMAFNVGFSEGKKAGKRGRR